MPLQPRIFFRIVLYSLVIFTKLQKLIWVWDKMAKNYHKIKILKILYIIGSFKDIFCTKLTYSIIDSIVIVEAIFLSLFITPGNSKSVNHRETTCEWSVLGVTLDLFYQSMSSSEIWLCPSKILLINPHVPMELMYTNLRIISLVIPQQSCCVFSICSL